MTLPARPPSRRGPWIAALCGALLAPRALAAADPTDVDVDVRGDASTAIAIEAPAFYGLTPAVSLRYHASAAPGLAGAGWNLVAGSQITRRSATGGIARMDATDRFYLDGDELIACASGSASPSCTTAVAGFLSSAGFYSTRTESFQRVRRDATGWTVWQPDGTRAEYGTGDGGGSYQLRAVTDTFNNRVDYTWTCAAGCELDRISYGAGPVELRFYREDRPDPRRERNGAGPIVRGQRLRSVVVRNRGALIRAYQLAYADSLESRASLLASVQQFGRDATVAADGRVSAGPTPPLPAMTFTTPSASAAGAWTLAAETSSPTLFDVSAPPVVPLSARYPDGFTVESRYENVLPPGGGDPSDATTTDNAVVSGDFDGDGRDELATWALRAQCSQIAFRVYFTDNAGGLPTAFDDPTVKSVGTTAPCSTGHAARPPMVSTGDLNNDGATDLIVGYGGELRRFLASGTGSFRAGPVVPWSTTTGGCTVADVDGDGRDDLACEDPTARQLVIRRSAPSGWVTTTVATATTAAPALPDHAGLALTGGDVDGDGLDDLILARPSGTSTRVILGRSRGDGSFDWSEEQSFGFTGVLSTADVDGDGRFDLVFARGNGVTELDVAVARKGHGTGRWRLVPRQSVAMYMTQLADVDGDGDADLIGRPTTGSQLAVAPATGDGLFGAVGPALASNCESITSGLMAIAPGDWNGDGLIDPTCLSINADGTASVHERPSGARGLDRHRWRRADLDGDGRTELVYISFRNPGYDITVVVPHTGQKLRYTLSPSLPGRWREPDAGRWVIGDVGSLTGPADGRDDLTLVEHRGGRLYTTTLLSIGLASFTSIEWDVTAAPDRSTAGWFGAIDGRDGRAILMRTQGIPGNTAGVRVDRLRPIGPGQWSFRRDTYFSGGGAPLLDRAARGFRPADVDGDGLTDLVQVDAAPGAAPVVRSLRPDGAGGLIEAAAVLPAGSITGSRAARLADLDGDGADDVVQIARTSAAAPCLAITHLAGDGKGGFAYSDRGGQACLATTDPTFNRLFEDAAAIALVDLDRDGEPELVHVSHAVDATGQRRLIVARVRRDRSGPLPEWRVTTHLPALAYDDGQAWRWLPYRDAVSGDAGLWYLHPQVSVALRWPRVRDELATVDNGRGRAAAISYGPYLGSRAAMPGGVIPRVVTRIETTDRAVAPSTTDAVVYAYTGATWSNERGLIGFATTSANDGRAISIARYALGDACGVQLTQREDRDPAGATYRYTTTGYEATGAAPPYRCTANAVTTVECERTATCRTARTRTFTRDANGNLRTAYDLADRAVTTATLTSFVINPVTYVLEAPSERYTLALMPSGWVTQARTAYRYDDLAAGAAPVRGAVTAVAEYDSQTGTFPTTSFRYDTHGNLIATTSPEQRVTGAMYDGPLAFHRCDAHQCTDTAYDPVTQQPISVTDANLATTTTTYDAHGRVIRVDRPDHGFTITRYLDLGRIAGAWSARQRVRTEVSDGSADGVLWTETWIDGSGRTRRVTGEGGATTTTEFADGSARPSRVSLVHDAAAAPTRWERSAYDGLGRLTRTDHADNTFATRSFAVAELTETDEVGNPTVRVTDGRGQVVAIVDALQHTTSFQLDGAGRVLTITDPLGNLDRTTWSTLGRRIATVDPDRGLRSYTFTPDGLMASMVDAKHQQVLWSYDDLGRIQQRRELDAGGTQVRKVTFTYDDAAGSHGASRGHLIYVDDTQVGTAITEERWYDVQGRPNQVRRCVDGTCMTEAVGFDLAGRIEVERYPDRNGDLGSDDVVRKYHDTGDLRGFGDLATLTWTPDHLVERIDLGNGTPIDHSYDAARRWLDRLDVGGGMATIGYEHDPLARVSHQLATGALDADLGYHYDRLGRLDEVYAIDPARAETFTYDAIGRITWSPALGDYAYDDAAHVHAMTSTTRGAERYYDASGNVTALYDDVAGQTRKFSMDWTVDDKLAAVVDNTAGVRHGFVYDVTGRRVKKVDDTGTTLYFGPRVEVDPHGRLIKSYLLGDRLIARDQGGDLRYFVQDLGHNTRLILDDLGGVAERREYTAFGQPFVPGPADIAFAGARTENTLGLILMGARTYDPTSGRFLSADSVIPSLGRPQSLDRYSYVENDPVNYWDPSGHMRYLVELKKHRITEDANFDDSPEAVIAAAGALGKFMWIDTGLSMDELLAIQRGHYLATYVHGRHDSGGGADRDHEPASHGSAPGTSHEASAAGGATHEHDGGGGAQVERLVRRDQTAGWSIAGVYEGLQQLDAFIVEKAKQALTAPTPGFEHDVFLFAGGGVSWKDLIPGFKFGPTYELIELAGRNEEGGYTETLDVDGWVIEVHALGEKWEVGVYAATAYTASGPKSGFMADLTLGSLSTGAYTFGANTKDTGTYGSLKLGHGFVGGGMSLQTNPLMPFGSIESAWKLYQAGKR